MQVPIHHLFLLFL